MDEKRPNAPGQPDPRERASESDDTERSRDRFARARRLVDVRPGEVVPVLWSGLYAFSVLASFYLLRPVREQAGLAYGKEHLSDLYLGTLIGTLVASPVFAWLVTRFPRRRFVPWVSHFFALNLVVFFLLGRALPESAARPVWGVFYSWLSVFNLFVVSVLWSLMADLWTHEQAKRLFGPIAVGGSLGAIAGSALTAGLAPKLGPVPLLLVSVAFLEFGVLAVARLVRIFRVEDEHAERARDAGAPETSARVEDAQHGGVWNGIRLVLGSRYLFLVALYVMLQSFVQTFMYFEQAHVVDAAIPDRAGQTALFGTIDLWVNVATVVVQLFLTGRIVKRLGIGTALALQPVLSAAAFVWLGASPTLGLLVGAQIVLRSVHYATGRPAREMLFTVVGREAKYKSKNFLDTFVYRGGDALAAQVVDVYKERGLGLVAALPFAIAWTAVAVLLGRQQTRIARSRAARASSIEPEVAAT